MDLFIPRTQCHASCRLRQSLKVIVYSRISVETVEFPEREPYKQMGASKSGNFQLNFVEKFTILWRRQDGHYLYHSKVLAFRIARSGHRSINGRNPLELDLIALLRFGGHRMAPRGGLVWRRRTRLTIGRVDYRAAVCFALSTDQNH